MVLIGRAKVIVVCPFFSNLWYSFFFIVYIFYISDLAPGRFHLLSLGRVVHRVVIKCVSAKFFIIYWCGLKLMYLFESFWNGLKSLWIFEILQSRLKSEWIFERLQSGLKSVWIFKILQSWLKSLWIFEILESGLKIIWLFES